MRIRHTECAGYKFRPALTLVELLVVIVILTMVTAATIPLMAPATGQRKVRESARLLATMLSQAQARAISTGRPVGVWIERLSGASNNDQANQAIDLFLCEVPPPYTGESTSAGCRIGEPNPAPSPTIPATAPVQLFEGTSKVTLPPKLIRRGDFIQFNYRGAIYKIIGPADVEGNINDPAVAVDDRVSFIIQPRDSFTNLPAPTPATTVPYQIFRQPVKSADAPANLPIGAIVDFTWSGLGGSGVEFSVPGDLRLPAAQRRNPLTNFPNNPVTGAVSIAGIPKPVLIMFGPSGSLDSIYYAAEVGPRPRERELIFESVKPITPVYLLVGQSPTDIFNPLRTNLNNQESVWVAVNPQSGLVTTSEVAIGPDYWETEAAARRVKDPKNPSLNEFVKAISDSRAFARSAQNMGGR